MWDPDHTMILDTFLVHCDNGMGMGLVMEKTTHCFFPRPNLLKLYAP